MESLKNDGTFTKEEMQTIKSDIEQYEAQAEAAPECYAHNGPHCPNEIEMLSTVFTPKGDCLVYWRKREEMWECDISDSNKETLLCVLLD